jgi:hypothetical protein
MPYTNYDKRHIRVEHRVRVLVYDEGTVDVLHERRRDDDGQRGDWKSVDVLEVRQHGVREVSVREGGAVRMSARELQCARCGDSAVIRAGGHGDRCRVCGGPLERADHGLGAVDGHESRESIYALLSAREGQDHD